MGRRSLERLHEDEQLEQLPVSRIKTIMKSSPEVEGIRKEALFLVNKATEFFVQFLASTAYVRANGAQELDYNYLSEIVQGDRRLTFMSDLFPKRITYKEYKILVEEKRKKAVKIKVESDTSKGTTEELPNSKGSMMKDTAEEIPGNSEKFLKRKELCTSQGVPDPNDNNGKEGIHLENPNSKLLNHSPGRTLCDESENYYKVGKEEKDSIDDNCEENIEDTTQDQIFSEKMQE